MKKLYWSFFVLVVITSCTSVKTYNAQITALHSVEDLRADVDKVYFQLKKNHPRLYQYTPKEVLDFKFDSLKTTINKPIDSRNFYKKLAPVVAHVRQGHISVGSADKHYTSKELKALKKRKFQFYDLDFDYIDNKLWVTHTRGQDSTIIGSEVVKIEDESVNDLIRIYKTRFSSDGYNKTLQNRYIGKVFSTLYYKDKGFVDSLHITFKSKDSLFTKTFKRVEKEEKKDSIANDSLKVEKKPELTKLEKKQKKIVAKDKRKFNKTHGFISKDKGYTRNFKFLEADSSIAYMKIASFSNGNYKTFYEESFAKIDSTKTQHLIIDLRDNGGGRISEIDKLYSYLTDKKYRLIEESEVNSRLPFFKYLMSNSSPNLLKVATVIASPVIVVHNLVKTKKRDGKLYYNLRFTKEKDSNPLNYKGNLYVLINGNSFSASSLLSTNLQATNRATFVGEETGGAYNGCVAGIYKIYELPTSKIKIRIGLMQIETAYKQEPDGYGIIPDVEILQTIDAIKAKKDLEVDWVINHVNQKKN